MVFHQPLIPVLPVARELISKTKWIGSKGSSHTEVHGHLGSALHAKAVEDDATSRDSPSPHRPWRKTLHRATVSSASLISSPLTSEPESTESKTPKKSSRSRVFRLFAHNSLSSDSSANSSVCLFLSQQALADCWSLGLLSCSTYL
jgi:hypothetical protein